MSTERETFGLLDNNSRKIRRTEAADKSGRRIMLGAQGQGNSSTPCAACKLLRRRCAQECPFSPYFSPHEPQKFASVHKVFGASNVSKMLMEVHESQRADAASSLVIEATARLKDPVHGVLGTVNLLEKEVLDLTLKLEQVRQETMRYQRHSETNYGAMAVSNYGALSNPNGRSAVVPGGNMQPQSTMGPMSDYNLPSSSMSIATPDMKYQW